MTQSFPFPTIVVLCGSPSYPSQFEEAFRKQALAGKIVLSPIWWDESTPPETRRALGLLHLHKIDLADEVLVVSDETGYFGESTWAEIDYAREHGKPVLYVHPAAAIRASERFRAQAYKT
jgi:hypothetical protein